MSCLWVLTIHNKMIKDSIPTSTSPFRKMHQKCPLISLLGEEGNRILISMRRSCMVHILQEQHIWRLSLNMISEWILSIKCSLFLCKAFNTTYKMLNAFQSKFQCQAMYKFDHICTTFWYYNCVHGSLYQRTFLYI